MLQSRNEFILHIVPPPHRLNWSNPRRLLVRTFLNHLFRDPAPIGHLFVEFGTRQPNAHGVSRVLTGMSRMSLQESSRVVRRQKLGLGSFFHDFRGRLDVATEALKEIEWAKKKNRHATIRVDLSDERASAMMNVMNDWIANGAFRHYGGGHVVFRGTGAGCAEFGMFFLSMALGVQAAHPDWYRDVVAPSEFLGGKPFGDRKVSFARMLMKGDAWASSEKEGRRYRVPDPELMFDWVMNQGGDVELNRGAVTWSSVPCETMQFTGGYPRELPDVVAQEWAKIWLK